MLEVIAEYGIAIAFIAVIIWLRNNSPQHVMKIEVGQKFIMEWLESREAKCPFNTTAIP